MQEPDLPSPPLISRMEETLPVAVLLSISGGYLDAFTWLVHDGVLANTQTANIVLLGVYMATGSKAEAFHHIPPIFAFIIGVATAFHLRCRMPQKNLQVSLIVEIVMLASVMLMHVYIPETAGILGISFAAALQTTSFTKVNGWNYSSVMTTGNLRQSVEALLAGLSHPKDPKELQKAQVFGALCISFGTGAALGAFLTLNIGVIALAIPIILLIIVLIRPRLRSRDHATKAS